MMNRKMALTGMALWMAALAGFVLPEAWADLARTAGLAGGQYGSEDFTNLEHFVSGRQNGRDLLSRRLMARLAFSPRLTGVCKSA